MRILVFNKNDGSHISNTVKCLRAKGIDAVGLTLYYSKVCDYEGIYVYKKWQFILFYIRFIIELFKCDLVHIFNGKLIPFTFWLIKFKPHVIEYTGEDIRNNELMDFTADEYVIGNKRRSHSNQNKFRNVLNIYTEAGLEKHLVNDAIYLTHRIPYNDYTINPAVNKPLRVAHSPSSREAKGTDLILEAVKGLELEFDLIENVSHKECLERIAKCDIFIDQMIWGSHGMASMEAMAMRKPVLCFINHGKDVGVIPCRPEEIRDRLIEYIEKPYKVTADGILSRLWVEKSVDKTINNLTKIYEAQFECKFNNSLIIQYEKTN